MTTTQTTTHLIAVRTSRLRAWLGTSAPWQVSTAFCAGMALMLALRPEQPTNAPLQPVLTREPIIMIATAQPTIPLPTPALVVLEVQPSATPVPEPVAVPPTEEPVYEVADVQPPTATPSAYVWPTTFEEEMATAYANGLRPWPVGGGGDPCTDDDPVVRQTCVIFGSPTEVMK